MGMEDLMQAKLREARRLLKCKTFEADSISFKQFIPTRGELKLDRAELLVGSKALTVAEFNVEVDTLVLPMLIGVKEDLERPRD